MITPTPYEEVGERLMVPNPPDPLVPHKLGPLELRTAVEGPLVTGPRIASSRDVAALMRSSALPGLPFLACLNAKNEPVLTSSLHHDGSTEELLQDAIAMTLLSGAVAAVFCSPHPDAHDIEMGSEVDGETIGDAMQMREAFELVGLRMLDVMLFNEDGHSSLLDLMVL